jgi:6-phosphogluconate dehydrogenase
MKKQIGYIGLGKMGANMVAHLIEKGYEVIASDPNADARKAAEKTGAKTVINTTEVIAHLNAPRTIWIMVPHAVTNTVIKELLPFLTKGDTIIDGGNSLYKNSMQRAKELAKKEINFLDAGVSGGPSGARNGACIMVGGDKDIFQSHEALFKDLSVPDGYGFMGNSGAGHFVKMVHNGIEYGMMQSIAEGFAVMEKSDFNLDLKQIADVYNHKSVIESRLIAWLKNAFEEYGNNLEGISGSVSHTGEGQWTVEAAKELGIPASIIEQSLQFRVESEKKPSFMGQILSALRNQFGGHKAK